MDRVVTELRAGGDVVEVVGPERFLNLPAPSYPEIRLAVLPRRRLARIAHRFAPDAIHVATEGPLGWAMRRLCRRQGWHFTTSYHTKFPEYLHTRTRAPLSWSWAVLRHFHAASRAVLVATPSLAGELHTQGIHHTLPWTRGVDLTRFRGEPRDAFEGLPRPIFLYAGRVAVEKNIGAFLSLDLPGSKVVIGDGPARPALQARFPNAHFTGFRDNGALAASYAGADVFVFPSRTDTFGLVMLEALASGTPVAAFPVTGPLDVIGDAPVGALLDNLRDACLAALSVNRTACRAHAERYSWPACAAQFRSALTAAKPWTGEA